ncbi:disintegrin and metalloproteinase domain-containing protein 5-like [Chionomys nivalis]|uniref:disintegrin and metalloproteinase domain-containing protein 5-like n=1 Tax=Chionomys nivalis TaxID=269649 RepID=UPI0025975996|nr:disintegrin and metalloproteinase domain-containing protein 5-like [Chionomys nivalis]
MFLLLVLFMGLSGLQAGQSPQKTILQTTVPEKISSLDVEKDPENHIAYLITIAEKPYFVHLKKQSYITSTSVIYTYDNYDIRRSQPLSFLESCTYNGYVAGFPNSLVTLSICSGLRGTIQFQNVSYGIEPVETISGFVHVIYEITNDNTEIPVLEEDQSYYWYNDSQFQFERNVKKTSLVKLSPRYFEMDIVVDKKLFDYMGSDIKTVIQKVTHVIGLVNTMFSMLELTVVIHSIEIWSKGNRISVPESPKSLLIAFLNWKRDQKQKHVSYLLAFDEHPASIGALYPGELCRVDFDVAVALYPKGLSLESYSVIVAQLLSLGMGLTYDNTDTCHCTGDVCLMTPKAIYFGGMKSFSTCSLDDFKQLSMGKDLGCLQDWPMERKPQRRPRRICGNGVLEGKEQCDCGTLKNCTHRACCDPMSCRLKSKALCGSGECCKQDCTLKPINTLCRKSTGECDFPEYCNGNLSYCGRDTYLRDGEYCDSGQAFCFHGLCRTTDKQCIDLLGKGVRGAPFWCHEELNSRGDRFGNCISHHCKFEDVLCGKLVCTWPFKRIVKLVNISTVYTHVQNDVCISFYKGGRIPKSTPTTYSTIEDRDETFVEDGTICGPDMYCKEAVCRELRFVANFNTCNATRDCNNHGFCNNFHHCHCEEGYNPPHCEEMRGQFGSIDDGHEFHIEGKSLMWRQVYGLTSRQWLQLIFYISLPAIIIIIALLIRQSKLRHLCYRAGSESNRSTSEDSGSVTKMTTSKVSSPAGLPITSDSERTLTVFAMKKS